MINRIIKHEWRVLRAERTVGMLAVLLFMSIGYGMWNGSSWARFRSDTVRRAETKETRQMKGMQAGASAIEAGAPTPESHSPTDATTVGLFDAPRYALLPPTPLSVLSVGQSDLYPSHFKITAQSKNTWSNSEEIDNPVNLLAGRFDVAFVVIYLMPLCIVALSFNLLSGERENGTLSMLLAQGVSLPTLLLGKSVARFLVVLALVLLFSFVGMLALGVKGAAIEGVVAWAALVTVYAAFWFSLALVVNLWGKGSASNAMTLLGCWLALVLLIPSMVGVVASTLYSVPSRLELIQANREAAAKAAAQSNAVLARYYEDHPDLLPKSQRVSEPDAYLRYFATQEVVAGSVEPLMAQYDAQLEKQQNLVNRLRFFSPAILAQEAMNDLSGTGFLRYRRFSSQANQFHDEYRSYFRDKAFARVKMASTDYDNIPSFQWNEEPFGETAMRQLLGIGALIVASVVLLFGAFSLMRRKDLIAG